MGHPIVILQDAIMAYRKPFYNALGAYYDVSVVHSGPSSVGDDDRYREHIVSVHRFGGLALQPAGAALTAIGPAKAVIAMFDLRWPMTLWAAWRANAGRRLLWGHRYSRRSPADAARDWVMRRFDGVVQYGEEDVPTMIDRGLDPSRIFLAPNTIDVPNHGDCSGAKKSSYLFVGRLQERKRLDELFRAFAAIRSRIPSETKIEIVGEGGIRTDLERLAAELGIADRVVMHGTITDAEPLKAIFARAFAYVSPDNVGLGVLHAFAYGVPVITGAPRESRQVGFRHGPEFHNLHAGENGLLFSNEGELREHMVALATDGALARRLGEGAYAHYRNRRSIAGMVDGFRRAIEWPNQPHGLAERAA